LVASDSTSVTVKVAESVFFDGGDEITSYFFMRDSGPLTPYNTAVESTAVSFVFDGLTEGVLYRFKV